MLKSRAYMGREGLHPNVFERLNQGSIARGEAIEAYRDAMTGNIQPEIVPAHRTFSRLLSIGGPIAFGFGSVLAACSSGGEGEQGSIITPENIGSIPTANLQLDESVLTPEDDVTFDNDSDEPSEPDPDFSGRAEIGQIVRNFSLLDENGKMVELNDFRGDLLILLVRRGYVCDICEHETQTLTNLINKFPDQNIQILTVQVDDTKAYPLTSVENNTVVFDPDMTIEQIVEYSGYPSTYFLDEEGVLRDLQLGIGEISEYVEIIQDMTGSDIGEEEDDFVAEFDNSQFATIGEIAPNFVLPDEFGNPVELSDFFDEPLIIEFTQPDCFSCLTNMTLIFGPSEGIESGEITGLIVNSPGSQGNVSELHPSYNVVFDYDTELNAVFGVIEFPTTFFVSNGVIQEIYVGPMDPLEVYQGKLRLLGRATE